MAKGQSHLGHWRVGWRFFGKELKRRREAAGMTQEELGRQVICSAGYVSQFENATRKPQLDHSKRFDLALQTDGIFERMWRELINRSPYADYFSDVADLEPLAQTICDFAPALVPGLLQTEAYARAVFRAVEPLLPDETIDERVASRLVRARVLKGSDGNTPPVYWAILDESVIRRPVGGPGVMSEQLTHIVRVARDQRVLVQVLPYSAGAHALMVGFLTLMTFADAPPVAYVESPHVGQLIDDPAIVVRHDWAYDLARASALPPEESLSLIEAVAEEYSHDHATRPPRRPLA